LGVEEINALSKQVQANLLEAFGVAADIKFVKDKAVAPSNRDSRYQLKRIAS